MTDYDEAEATIIRCVQAVSTATGVPVEEILALELTKAGRDARNMAIDIAHTVMGVDVTHLAQAFGALTKTAIYNVLERQRSSRVRTPDYLEAYSIAVAHARPVVVRQPTPRAIAVDVRSRSNEAARIRVASAVGRLAPQWGQVDRVKQLRRRGASVLAIAKWEQMPVEQVAAIIGEPELAGLVMRRTVQ